METVRSGAAPERAAEFMAGSVLAHQVRSEQTETVTRTPEQYAEHVREMIEAFGAFEFRVDELIVDGDRAYARWTQHGHHLAEIDGYAPTGQPVTEVASAVYRVENGLIAEYWIQIDRAGLTAQLEASIADVRS
jgi:predicted ester cyclase